MLTLTLSIAEWNLLVREKSFILKTKLQPYTGTVFYNRRMFSATASRHEEPSIWMLPVAI